MKKLILPIVAIGIILFVVHTTSTSGNNVRKKEDPKEDEDEDDSQEDQSSNSSSGGGGGGSGIGVLGSPPPNYSPIVIIQKSPVHKPGISVVGQAPKGAVIQRPNNMDSQIGKKKV